MKNLKVLISFSVFYLSLIIIYLSYPVEHKGFFDIDFDENQLGPLGDFVGGLINPVIGIFTIYFIYLTYIETRKILIITEKSSDDQLAISIIMSSEEKLNRIFSKISELYSEKLVYPSDFHGDRYESLEVFLRDHFFWNLKLYDSGKKFELEGGFNTQMDKIFSEPLNGRDIALKIRESYNILLKEFYFYKSMLGEREIIGKFMKIKKEQNFSRLVDISVYACIMDLFPKTEFIDENYSSFLDEIKSDVKEIIDKRSPRDFQISSLILL